MGQTISLDKSTLVEFMEHRKEGSTEAQQFISNSVNYVGFGLPAGLLITGLVTHDEELKKKALYIGESVVVSSVITFALKYSVNRSRPFATYPGQIIPEGTGGSPSFPSGHTSLAFSTATAAFLACPKWYVAVPAFAYATSVGYSRMYLGVHYPTDVAAGALVGIGSAWLTYKANQWLNRRSSIRKLPPL
ncbi:phosphatase PAP2 family protein [Flavihumibacter rivuli]|uniref:phosphatase PAP2 family protein n=1 Tax=Flavihumibacter rivuli TaxID=2838156 RepID=UPI001EFBA99C|nr:phosphatase PAP2 family protein [Flavihumibacter rivuli]ULQ57433.1 phosphatase PAP2 family protein [Flavihumibacter rivuli]